MAKHHVAACIDDSMYQQMVARAKSEQRSVSSMLRIFIARGVNTLGGIESMSVCESAISGVYTVRRRRSKVA